MYLSASRKAPVRKSLYLVPESVRKLIMRPAQSGGTSIRVGPDRRDGGTRQTDRQTTERQGTLTTALTSSPSIPS